MGSRTVKKKSKRQKGLRSLHQIDYCKTKMLEIYFLLIQSSNFWKKKLFSFDVNHNFILEKSRLEKNTHFLSLIPFSPSEISSQPMELVLKINPKKLGYYSVYPSNFIFSRVILEKTEQKKTIWGNYSVLGFAKSCSSSTSRRQSQYPLHIFTIIVQIWKFVFVYLKFCGDPPTPSQRPQRG